MRKFFKAVAFVTIFSVLTRAIGFFLRIYLSRVLGAEALGSYQISLSIFGVLMTLVSSGLPLIISRNVAYYVASGEEKQANKTLSAGLYISLAISVIVCVLFGAFPQILGLFIKSKESINIILFLLPALIAEAVYSILRGGLWGKKKFFTISFAEFFEQVVRIIFCVILFSVPIGITVGQKAALSLTLSCISSCVLVVVLYFAFGGKITSGRGAYFNVAKSSTPVTLVRTISSVVGSIVAVLIPLRLTKYGLSTSEALAQYGIFMGMTMPIIMIPNTFTSSIAVALLPEMSSYTNNIDEVGTKNISALRSQVEMAVKTTIIISLILLPCFVALGKPICQFLFNNATAGTYLSVCAVLMLPMGLCHICSSMLNAIGLELKALASYGAGAVVLVLCIYFLPQFIGVYAILVGMFAMNTISCALCVYMLYKRKLIGLKFFKTIFTMSLVCLPTTLQGYLSYKLLRKFCGLITSLALSGIVTFGLTVLLLFVFDIASISVVFSKFKLSKKRKGKKVLQKAKV